MDIVIPSPGVIVTGPGLFPPSGNANLRLRSHNSFFLNTGQQWILPNVPAIFFPRRSLPFLPLFQKGFAMNGAGTKTVQQFIMELGRIAPGASRKSFACQHSFIWLKILLCFSHALMWRRSMHLKVLLRRSTASLAWAKRAFFRSLTSTKQR